MWSGSEGSNKSNNNNNNTSLNTSPFRPFCAGNEGRLILPWNLFAGCVYILLPGIVLSIPCYQQGEKEATGVSVQTGDSETRVSPFPLLNHILGGWRAMRRGMGQRDYFYWDSSSGLIKRLVIFSYYYSWSITSYNRDFLDLGVAVSVWSDSCIVVSVERNSLNQILWLSDGRFRFFHSCAFWNL